MYETNIQCICNILYWNFVSFYDIGRANGLLDSFSIIRMGKQNVVKCMGLTHSFDDCLLVRLASKCLCINFNNTKKELGKKAKEATDEEQNTQNPFSVYLLLLLLFFLQRNRL